MADTPSPDDAIFGDKDDQPIGGGAAPPPPPPPPPPAAPLPPPGAGRNSGIINEAFSWAIEVFRQHAVVFIGLAAIVFALKLAQGVAGSSLGSGRVASGTASAIDVGLVVTASILGIVFAILSALASIGVYRAALRRTQGVTPSLDQLVTGENLGRFIVVSIVLGLAVGLGLALCLAPGLLALFFFLFAPYLALDKGYGVGDAFRTSYRMVLDNLGVVFVAGLVAILANLLSGLIYGVLTLVMLPFSALFTAYVYRRVQGEPVAP